MTDRALIGNTGQRQVAYDQYYEFLAPLAAVFALILANLMGGYADPAGLNFHSAAWAAVIVAVLGFWATDVSLSSSQYGREIPIPPIYLSILVSVGAVHLGGTSGLGIGVAAAVIITLAWGVLHQPSRDLSLLTTALSMSAVVAGAAGSLMLARVVWDPGKRIIGVFLAIVLAAVIGRLISERFSHITFSEPFTITALLTVAASVAASSAWDLDIVVFLLVGLILATVIVAGRGFGTMIRSGTLSLAPERIGYLGSLDGVVLASAVYLPLLRLLL